MRVAIFVAVVAAHVGLLLLFLSLRHPLRQGNQAEVWITSLFLPPSLPESPPQPAVELPWQAPLLYRSASGLPGRTTFPARRLQEHLRSQAQEQAEQGAQPQVEPQSEVGQEVQQRSAIQQQPSAERMPGAPDWRAEAELEAQLSAQKIVTAEEDAARKAAALTARFKPLAPSRARGPEFGWDYAPTHRFSAIGGGGFIYRINDNCAVLVLIVPFIGCTIGKQEANGHLFDHMHDPPKFGDWDWRVKDP